MNFNNLLHKPEIDTNLTSNEQKLEALKKRQKGLSTNYNLSAILIMLFVYYMYQANKEGPAPIWLFVFFGILIVGAIIIIWYDLKNIKTLKTEIAILKEKIDSEKDEASSSESEDASLE